MGDTQTAQETLGALLLGQWGDADRMSKADLQSEVKLWRAVVSWLDDDTKHYLAHMGQLVRVVRRDYHGFLGEFIRPMLTLKGVAVNVYEEFYDNNVGHKVGEQKIVELTTGAIVNIEFIEYRRILDATDEEELGKMGFKEGGQGLEEQ